MPPETVTEEKSEISGALIEGPSSDPNDAELWAQIESAKPSNVLAFLQAWHKRDKPEAVPPKGEFETTDDYAARKKAAAGKPYSSNCFAFVEAGNFNFDADTESAIFSGGALSSSWDSDTLGELGNVRFSRPAELVKESMEATVPLETAKALRGTDGESISIVRIFSLAGTSKPAISGWSSYYDPFDHLKIWNEEEWSDAYDTIMRTTYEIDGELVKVAVIPGPGSESNQILFEWQAKDAAC